MTVRKQARRGAHIVEAAIVLPIVLLLILGIFEYCRFIFLLQVAENAAREGARYAVARTGDGTTIAQVRSHVNNAMAGRQAELAGYTVSVENVNPDTGAVITGSAWNDAPFGGAIRVRVSGTYSFIIPSLLNLPSTLPISISSMMSSEAN
jgi:Flp pilus assembly protein TadG